MKNNAPTANDPTDEEREALIVNLADTIEPLLHNQRLDVAVSALASLIVSAAVSAAGYRPSMVGDLRNLAAGIQAMGDTEDRMEAMHLFQSCLPGQSFTEEIPAGTMLQ